MHSIQPARRWVRTGEILGHQPSLTLANDCVSYGWQATRRLSTEARSAKVDYRLAPPLREARHGRAVDHRRDVRPVVQLNTSVMTATQRPSWMNRSGPPESRTGTE